MSAVMRPGTLLSFCASVWKIFQKKSTTSGLDWTAVVRKSCLEPVNHWSLSSRFKAHLKDLSAEYCVSASKSSIVRFPTVDGIVVGTLVKLTSARGAVETLAL